MSGPENTFIDSVHKHLPPEDDLHREGMHNAYRGGTADVWYSGQYDLWVEYKFIHVPKRDGTVISLVSGKNPALSILQQQWLARRLLEGRSVAVIVGCKDGGVVFTGVDWREPFTAAEFRRCLTSRKEVAGWIVNHVGVFTHAASVSTTRQRAVRVDKNRDNRVPARIDRDAPGVHGEAFITTSATRDRRTKRK